MRGTVTETVGCGASAGAAWGIGTDATSRAAGNAAMSSPGSSKRGNSMRGSGGMDTIGV